MSTGSGRPDGRPRRPSFRPDILRPGPPYLTEVEDNVVEAANPNLATILPSLEAGDNNRINNINTDRGQSVNDPTFDLHDEGSKANEKLHLGRYSQVGKVLNVAGMTSCYGRTLFNERERERERKKK